ELELRGRPFAGELRIEQSSTVQHSTRDLKEPINDGAQSPRMAVTFGPEGVVFGPTGGVVLNRVLRPVIGGVSQAMIAGIPAHHYPPLAATWCHRGRSTEKPQRMIISALQSV